MAVSLGAVLPAGSYTSMLRLLHLMPPPPLTYMQAPAHAKLPVLYLLDSVAKTVGAPYITYFAPALPEVSGLHREFACCLRCMSESGALNPALSGRVFVLQIFRNAWVMGAPALHRPLEKLLGTWTGVFPAHVLDAVRTRLAQPSGAGNGYAAYGALVGPKQNVAGIQGWQGQVRRGTLLRSSLIPTAMAHPPAARYGAPQPAYPPQPYLQPPPQAMAPYPAAGAIGLEPGMVQMPAMPVQQAPPAIAPLPDLISSLLSSGLLTAPGAAPPAAAAPAPAPRGKKRAAAGPPAAALGSPASVEFSADRIKVPGASMMSNPTTIFFLIKHALVQLHAPSCTEPGQASTKVVDPGVWHSMHRHGSKVQHCIVRHTAAQSCQCMSAPRQFQCSMHSHKGQPPGGQ